MTLDERSANDKGEFRELLTPLEEAALLKVSRAKVYRLPANGELESRRLEIGNRRVDHAALHRF